MNYSFGIERDEVVLAQNDADHRKWSNPLEMRCVDCLDLRLRRIDMWNGFDRLPNAPSMRFVCVYGHGKETEVGCARFEQALY